MAVLTRQLRDASDEILDPVNSGDGSQDVERQRFVELSEQEWLQLEAADSALRQNWRLRILKPVLITTAAVSFASFLFAVGSINQQKKLEAKLNESIARGKEAMATFNENIGTANFRLQLLESSHSSAAYRDTSGKTAAVPNVPLADKNQQVQWINFDAAKMELEGRKVESIRLEVRSKPIKSKVQNVQSPTSTNYTGQATGSQTTIAPVFETTESKKEKP